MDRDHRGVPRTREGEREAALNAMSASFASVGVPALGGVFLGFIALIGLNAALAHVDSSSRDRADPTYDPLLPEPIRPRPWTKPIIVVGALLYLGVLLYGLFRFGVIVS